MVSEVSVNDWLAPSLWDCSKEEHHVEGGHGATKLLTSWTPRSRERKQDRVGHKK
jgi:hypothetical protein